MGNVIHITADILRRQAGEALREMAAPYEDRVWQRVTSGLGEKDHGKAANCADSAGRVVNGRPSADRTGNKGHAAEQGRRRDSGDADGIYRLPVGHRRDRGDR